MGHQLEVFDDATQQSTGAYGAKVFYYRGVILEGKMELDAAYSDYVWVHRDEAVDYLSTDDFLYLHQVFGGDSDVVGYQSAQQLVDARQS